MKRGYRLFSYSFFYILLIEVLHLRMKIPFSKPTNAEEIMNAYLVWPDIEYIYQQFGQNAIEQLCREISQAEIRPFLDRVTDPKIRSIVITVIICQASSFENLVDLLTYLREIIQKWLEPIRMSETGPANKKIDETSWYRMKAAAHIEKILTPRAKFDITGYLLEKNLLIKPEIMTETIYHPIIDFGMPKDITILASEVAELYDSILVNSDIALLKLCLEGKWNTDRLMLIVAICRNGITGCRRLKEILTSGIKITENEAKWIDARLQREFKNSSAVRQFEKEIKGLLKTIAPSL